MSSSGISLSHPGVPQETPEPIHRNRSSEATPAAPRLVCRPGFSPGLPRVGLERGFRILGCPPSARPLVGTASKFSSASEVSARMFLSHISDVASVPKYMGLASAWSLHTSVKVSMSTSVQHHDGHQRDTVQPRRTCTSPRTRALGGLIGT